MALSPAAAQSAEDLEALRSEIQKLKASQAQIRRELATLKKLLQQDDRAVARPNLPDFKPTGLNLADSPFLGAEDAKVTLVEFTDYQCPFCRRHFAGTRPQLVKDYVETGKLKYVSREFPILSIHPQAGKAAEAALCAKDQGKYWDMGALLFQNQKNLGPEALLQYAKSLKLEMPAFKECLEGGSYAKRVKDDFKLAGALGVRGTPSFLIGITDPSDPEKMTATEILRGAQPYGAFKRIIDALLAKQGNPS